LSRKKLSDRDVRHDEFHRRARKQGYAARSVFKLSEIDDKHHIVEPGARVLDLGCRPGSWLQYCRDKRASALVGIDREPLDIAIPEARIIVGDVHEVEPAELLGDLERFDVVLSDMAPDTSGVKHMDQARSEALFERALWIAEATLAPGGSFVGKLFQGPEFQALIKRCRGAFGSVKMVKPKGSRTASIEQYVVAVDFAGNVGRR
jgi:23S rRNA (uridine2552-2'-O)-methyltransferase